MYQVVLQHKSVRYHFIQRQRTSCLCVQWVSCHSSTSQELFKAVSALSHLERGLSAFSGKRLLLVARSLKGWGGTGGSAELILNRSFTSPQSSLLRCSCWILLPFNKTRHRRLHKTPANLHPLANVEFSALSFFSEQDERTLTWDVFTKDERGFLDKKRNITLALMWFSEDHSLEPDSVKVCKQRYSVSSEYKSLNAVVLFTNQSSPSPRKRLCLPWILS